LSHEKTEINFSEKEKALIDGSSGAGKSSIFDAIIWALYGQSRADNRALVRKGFKKGGVCLEFTRRDGENNNDTVIIARTITTAGKHTLEVTIQGSNGDRKAHPFTGVKELQTWIDKDLIGASYLLFINSVAYVQGNSESFVSQTAPKRKELLLEIVKAEDYKKYYENARKIISVLENEQNRASGQIMELESLLGANRAKLGSRGALSEEVVVCTTKINELKAKISLLEEELRPFLSIKQTIENIENIFKIATDDKNSIESNIIEKRKKISCKSEILWIIKNSPVLELNIKNANTLLMDMRIKLASVSGEESQRNEYYAKRPVVVDRSAQIEQYKEQIIFLKNKKDCPSGDKCPYQSRTLQDIEFSEKAVAELIDLTNKENIALVEWVIGESKLSPATDMNELIKKIGEIEESLKSLEEQKSKIVSAQKDLENIAEIEKEVSVLEQAIRDKMVIIRDTMKRKEMVADFVNNEEFNRINNELEAVKIEKDLFGEKFIRATAALEDLEEKEKEIKEIEKKVSLIKEKEMGETNEKIRKVTFIKEAFGSKGIETLVIDFLLPKLEDRINKILSQLSDFRVRLDTQRKSADGEGIVEGLFITILNESNEELPFEAYSGGEKLKIMVSISEALATLQKVGFRLFDETFLGLDENSTESFADVLNGLQKEFSQILCISHLPQIKDLFSKKINIIKTNSISYVQ
jgi:DNA repair exonuclease SbcCD ATPase subunit